MKQKEKQPAAQSLPVEPANEQSIDPRTPENRQIAFQQAIEYVEKKYLAALENYSVEPLSGELKELAPHDLCRVFRITDMVYAKDEDFLQKAVTFLYSAYALKANVIVILHSDGKTCEYYMGVSCPNDLDNLTDVAESFQSSFSGNFMGSHTTGILSNKMFDEHIQSAFSRTPNITSVSGIPSLRHADKHSVKSFIQGLENLADSLMGCAYTLMIQATPVQESELADLQLGYESIYTSLSPFAKTEYNYNAAKSHGTNVNYQKTVSVSETESTTETTSNTTGKQSSHTEGSNQSKSINKGAIAAGGILLAAASIGVLVGTGGVAAPAVAGAAKIAGAAKLAGAAKAGVALASGPAAILNGLLGTETTGTSSSDTISTSKTTTTSFAKNKGRNRGVSKGISQGESTQDTQGQSVQFSTEDKCIQNILTLIEDNIKRIQQCKNFGTFSSCAYVFSDSVSINKRAASVFAALMRGDASYTQSAQIHTWIPSHGEYQELKEYLSRFLHPQFRYQIGEEIAYVTPAMLISGEELALQIGLPKRAIPGVSVREVAEFGCNPNQPSDEDRPQALSLGSIQRLTQEISTQVFLDAKSLTAHAFITGSTGAGKSNTIYTMLDKLCYQRDSKGGCKQKEDTHFLVIEPAKGEYKEDLGGLPGVSVYGTNPRKTKLLKLNPFSFPDDTLVLEHIDRLVEIFNACWPMYAAMPAVLKAAIEQAYTACGWSLNTSTYLPDPATPTYPTFRDVMSALPVVIDSKGFSKDTQGDYKGALLTRIESLTNGINGQVLCAVDELSDEDLFEKNVIVDLSRVGSTETKALLMGILILKLQEFRMAQRAEGKVMSNSELRHITVLEEAHNLLRRTSSEQSQESSNLQGKSVEMLTTAIAEMRTFGEGFIIADQSPGLLDMAVIRNTNTKIILRLPDESDRQLVGKAAGLNDDQIIELSRLDTGVAAVYQNHWIEPVLCKVEKFEHKAPYLPPKNDDHSPVNSANEKFFAWLVDGKEGWPLAEEDTDSLCRWITQMKTNDDVKKYYLYLLKQHKRPSADKCNEALYCIANGEAVIPQSELQPSEIMRQLYLESQIQNSLQISAELANRIRQKVELFVLAHRIKSEIKEEGDVREFRK